MKKLYISIAFSVFALRVLQIYAAPSNSNPDGSKITTQGTNGLMASITRPEDLVTLNFKKTASLRRAVDAAFSEIQYSFESEFLSKDDTYSLCVSYSPNPPTTPLYPDLNDVFDDALNDVIERRAVYVSSFVADWDDALKTKNTTQGLWEDLLQQIWNKISAKYLTDDKRIEVRYVFTDSPLKAIDDKNAHMTHLYFLMGSYEDKENTWLGEKYDHSSPLIVSNAAVITPLRLRLTDFDAFSTFLASGTYTVVVFSHANRKLFAPLLPKGTKFVVMGSEDGSKTALEMLNEKQAVAIITSHLPPNTMSFHVTNIPSIVFSHGAWYYKDTPVIRSSFFQAGFFVLLAAVVMTLLSLGLYVAWKYLLYSPKSPVRLPTFEGEQIGAVV